MKEVIEKNKGGRNLKKKQFVIALSAMFSLTLTSSISSITVHAEKSEESSIKFSSLPLNGKVPETLAQSTKIELENGMTKPIYSIDEAIVEKLYVETEIDSDLDWKKDLVSIKVMRPKTEPGVKVPVIYEMSPYRSGINNVPAYNVDEELYPTEGKPFAEPANLGSYGN